MNDRIPQQDISEWAPAEVSEIDLYEKREKIYTRKIEGLFQRVRLFTGWPLLIGYLILPWLSWGGRQAVLFDLPARKFHVLGLTFWPQDLSLLGLILIIAAFSLFLLTALFGRVWCGYTCPQTVWTAIFMWCEQKAEGTRNQRIRLDNGPWNSNKIARKSLKFCLWFGVAFATGFTFVGYFTPIRELGVDLFTGQAQLMAVAWVVFFTLATYINAGYMREQVCKYMCPYARFQSAMFDKDTLIVSYDAERGEPRGSRKRGESPAAIGMGDCVDCKLCVQVCPVGIDIRDGLQYQCIACALCIDACDSIMARLEYPPGLIRYTTENSLKGLKTHFLRPRTLGYGAAVLLMVLFFAWRLLSIEPVEIAVLHDRDHMSSLTSEGAIENRYTVKIANKTASSQRYQIRVLPEQFRLIGQSSPYVLAGEVVSVRVHVVTNDLKNKVTNVQFHVHDEEGNVYRHENRFIGLLQ